MDSTLQVALGEQGHLEEFFRMMKAGGWEEQGRDMEELFGYLEQLKTGFSDALEKISYLRDQIDAMQNQSIKARLMKMQEHTWDVMQQIKSYAADVVQSAKEGMEKAVQAGKEKGIQASCSLVDAAHIEQGLAGIETACLQAHASLAGTASRTEQIAGELHMAKAHIKNAGKLAAGRQADRFSEREAYQGFLGKIQKSIEYCQKLMSSLVLKTQKARAHMVIFDLVWKEQENRYLRHYKSGRSCRLLPRWMFP